MPSPDIICLGEPLFELNQPKGEDIFRQGHGGDTSNCAIAAARQGVRVGYLTAIGADQFGESFLTLWAEEGVDTSAVRRSPSAHTGLYFITHGPSGHVFSYMRAGSAASRMVPEDVPADYVRNAKVFHASGISQAISSSAADAVFAAINSAFLSPLNISNTLTFTVELGLIALAMTLLMTAGEFDLSVGSVFGFAPVVMWTLYNAGLTSLFVGFVDTLGRSYFPDILRVLLSPEAASTLAPALSSMLIYLLMAIVLIVKPEGLFSSSGGR